MAVHQVGGESVEVTTASRYYWFYRKQGVDITVSPSRNWWCLWLCSGSKKVDEIRCSISLSGVVPTHEASNSCSNCGNLKIWGPSFWGGGVPQAYQQAKYSGTVKISGQAHAISGSLIYT